GGWGGGGLRRRPDLRLGVRRAQAHVYPSCLSRPRARQADARSSDRLRAPSWNSRPAARDRDLPERSDRLVRGVRFSPRCTVWAVHRRPAQSVPREADFMSRIVSIQQLADAAAAGDGDGVRRLLGEDPELALAYTDDGWTALHLAATPGNRRDAAGRRGGHRRLQPAQVRGAGQ